MIVLNIRFHAIYRKFDKNYIKTLKIVIFAIFTIFGVIQRSFGSIKKVQKISANTYRMILILRQLNSMGETLQLGYKFVALQIL